MKKYRFDQYRQEAQIDPFVLEVDDERSITIPAPTTDALLRLEEAGGTREKLTLLCGQAGPEVMDLLNDQPMHVMIAFLRDLAAHHRISLDRPPVGGTGASSS